MINDIKKRWWLIVGGLCVTMIAHGQILLDYYSINGDSTSMLLWMNGLTLEKIASNPMDIMTAYATYFVSAGVKGIYSVLGLLMDPILAVKIVPVISSLACILMMYEIGYLMAGQAVANLSGGIFLLLAWYYRHREMFGSADAEEIAIVLMLGFLWALLKKRSVWVGVILLLSALTYPPLFVLEIVTLCIFLAAEIWKKKALPLPKTACAILGVSCLAAGGYLVNHVFIGTPDFLGRILTYQEVLAEGMFNIGGNKPMFGDGTIAGRIFNDASGIGIDGPKIYLLIIFFCALCLPFKIFRKKLNQTFPAEMWYFLAAGMILTVIANAVMFKLYQPSRYIQIPLNVFLTFFAACAIACFEAVHARPGRWLRYCFIIGLLCIVAPRLYGHRDGPFRERYLVEYVKTLPDTSFLAGHPRELNGIGVFAKKRIFLTRKLATDVYWKTYRDIMTERTRDFFKAYYSDTADGVAAFAAKYGVTHFILYARHFSEDYLNRRDFYDNPFNAAIDDYLKGREHFYLYEKMMDYQKAQGPDQEIFVFDCKTMEIVYGSVSLPLDSLSSKLRRKFLGVYEKARGMNGEMIP
jgi:hypothetical protein